MRTGRLSCRAVGFWSWCTPGRLWSLVFLAACAVHAPALSSGLIWLDHAHLEQGLALSQPEGGLFGLFTRGFAGTGFYRPLLACSLSLDAALGGAPWLYHAHTLAWHAAASTMTAFAAKALGFDVRAQLVAGLTFAVHPLTSLVAGAIAFRSEAMLAVALLALIVFHSARRPALAALSLFLGGLCKETALLLGPLFITALEFGSAKRRAVRGRIDRRALLLAEAAALTGLLGLRALFAPNWRASFPELAAAEAIGTRLAALAKSGARLLGLTPLDHSVCDAFPVTSIFSFPALAGGLLAASLVYAAWRFRGPPLLAALALIPSLQPVPIMRWWSPHYLYVPLAFAAIAIAPIVGARARLGWWLIALAAFAVQTLPQTHRLRSDQALWQGEIARHPECREAHFYLGEVARNEKRWDSAALHYERAIAASPEFLSYVDLGAAYTNLGAIELERRRPSAAIGAFRAALARSTHEAEQRRLRHNLATALLLSGDAAAAARELETEVARPDALRESVLVRAKALRALGREADARVLAERLLERTGR
jgi:tetratricopeptide (TPR) repeat protein